MQAQSHPLEPFFQQVVRNSYEGKLGLNDPDMTGYVAHLLCEFSEAENLYKMRDETGRPVEELTEMLLASDPVNGTAASFDAERALRKHIGDYSLFVAGMYPEAAGSNRRLRHHYPSLEELIRGDGFRHIRAVASDDGRRALAVAREIAPSLGVDPGRIGMIGFSAGAFVTADVALDPGGAPLAFAAPIYGGETQGAAIPADAPPLFTCIAQDDRILFKVVEGLYADWSNADRPAELHIFARGGHGFGMVRRGWPVDRWIELFGDWLADRGFA